MAVPLSFKSSNPCIENETGRGEVLVHTFSIKKLENRNIDKPSKQNWSREMGACITFCFDIFFTVSMLRILWMLFTKWDTHLSHYQLSANDFLNGIFDLGCGSLYWKDIQSMCSDRILLLMCYSLRRKKSEWELCV